MRDWKLFKNTYAEDPCWQIYYKDGENRRYYDCAMDYPKAAALRDALMDPEIRAYALEYVQISNAERYPSNRAFEYTKAHFEIYCKMLDLPRKYGSDDHSIYERLIVDAINDE